MPVKIHVTRFKVYKCHSRYIHTGKDEHLVAYAVIPSDRNYCQYDDRHYVTKAAANLWRDVLNEAQKNREQDVNKRITNRKDSPDVEED